MVELIIYASLAGFTSHVFVPHHLEHRQGVAGIRKACFRRKNAGHHHVLLVVPRFYPKGLSSPSSAQDRKNSVITLAVDFSTATLPLGARN